MSPIGIIGPEHLLSGLVREGGRVSRVLAEFGATLEDLRRQVAALVERGDGLRRNQSAAITPHARRVMEFAASEARSLGSSVIATEHILLGIICEGDGAAYRVLQHKTPMSSAGLSWPGVAPRNRVQNKKRRRCVFPRLGGRILRTVSVMTAPSRKCVQGGLCFGVVCGVLFCVGSVAWSCGDKVWRGGAKMSDTSPVNPPAKDNDASYKALFDHYMTETKRLQQRMVDDRRDILKLQTETRAILEDVMTTPKVA